MADRGQQRPAEVVGLPVHLGLHRRLREPVPLGHHRELIREGPEHPCLRLGQRPALPVEDQPSEAPAPHGQGEDRARPDRHRGARGLVEDQGRGREAEELGDA